MILRLDRMGDEPFEWQEPLQPSPEELEESEILEVRQGTCRGRVQKTSSGFLLHADLAYEQILQCTRCLRDFAVPVTNELDLLVMVGQDAADEERALHPADLGVLWVREPVLDTRSLLLEQLHLSVPMKSLCRQDCAGLCSSCGADLNSGPCGCGETIDARWALLKELSRKS
jgi:uncharacterized protein